MIFILEQFQDTMAGQLEERTYSSNETAVEDSPLDVLSRNVADRNIENIYNKTPPGIPVHQLRIKVGSIMMLMRNINISEGLCNGTRVQILEVKDNIIVCKHLSGNNTDKIFLSRHRFTFGGDDELDQFGGVKWQRVQFPLTPGAFFDFFPKNTSTAGLQNGHNAQQTRNRFDGEKFFFREKCDFFKIFTFSPSCNFFLGDYHEMPTTVCLTLGVCSFE